MLSYLKRNLAYKEICKMETFLHILIFFGCFALAFWFTFVQFYRYARNEDLSMVSYRPFVFDSISEDQPPTYTICIMKEYATKSSNLFKKDSAQWLQNNITYKEYFDYLSGSLVLNWENKQNIFSSVIFEDVVLDVNNDVMLGLHTLDTNGKKVIYDNKMCDRGGISCFAITFCLVLAAILGIWFGVNGV